MTLSYAQAALPDRLQAFLMAFAGILDGGPAETVLLAEGANLLGSLVASDDWLPASFAVPSPDRYSQYALYIDPARRFSVVSFVWGPGQATPIHDHTTWGLIGMLRGAEVEQHYERQGDGTLIPIGQPHRLEPGQVDSVSPQAGDLHRVANAYDDRVSISIHVYGGDIGATRRSVYGLDGSRKEFVSGYTSAASPRHWAGAVPSPTMPS